ncbi:hypothetical protein FOA52_014145 [Chlamydomonas sp. UWO 241]|nr:hypothetical protein FOA52_014145 [Chlamydomonas sp. UWO 241]
MEGSGEVKAETINVLVRDQTGGEVHFKVKPQTKFGKVMDAYCNKKAVDPASMRFMFDGSRIQKEHTPAQLDMEDGDVVDAVVEQLGMEDGDVVDAMVEQTGGGLRVRVT